MKAVLNPHLIASLKALSEGEEAPISKLCNMIAALYTDDDHISWAGIYFIDRHDGHATLGPFQGKPACMTIAPHKGVIGASVDQRQSLYVEDVHAFPGHIACDSASESEIVIPLYGGSHIRGVLDIDSDIKAYLEPYMAVEEDLCRLFSHILDELLMD